MNSIKAKDSYRIETTDALGQGQLIALMLLYQPIIGFQAVNIYLTMYAEKRHLTSFVSMTRLLLLMNIDINTFSVGLKKCEELSLIRTHYNESNGRYIFSLVTPYNTEQFLKNDIFSRLLLKVLGTKEYEYTLKKLTKTFVEKTDYVDVSHRFDCNLIDSWDEEKELEFIQIKPKMKFSDEEKMITFDYDKFLKITNKMLFPHAARTNENLKMIGEYATIYGISPEAMRAIVAKSSDPFSNKLDVGKLRAFCKSSKPEDKKVKSPYLLSCISFLQSKQNGAVVPEYEKNLLEHLLIDMQLAPEVINVLVEYALNKNNNKLNKNFVDSIASALKRSNVVTYDEALKVLNDDNKKTTKKNSTKYEIPDYVAKEATQLSNEELNELEKWLKGGK